MTIFRPDQSRSVVSSWVNSNLEICPHEIQSAIEHEKNEEDLDLNLGFGSVAIGILSSAVVLGLAGISVAMVPSIALAVVGAVHGYNSGIQSRRRELEGEFISKHPEVLDSIKLVLDHGQPVHKVASGFESVFRLYRRGHDSEILQAIADPRAHPSAKPIEKSGPEIASRDGNQTRTQNEPQPIGNGEATRATDGDRPAMPPTKQHITSPVWNPGEDLGNNPQSALIVGVPGSGKGILISNAVRTLKNQHPNVSIYVIDPKADPKERGYWEGISDSYRAFSLMKCVDPDEGASWLLDCMDDFLAIDGPKLCIFDELMSASTELSLASKEMKALARLKKFVVGLIGQGDSQSAWLWALTQSPNVSDLGMSGGIRANLRVIGLVSPKNLAAVEALTSTKLIPPPEGGMDELRKIMASSPVDRAFFDGKLSRWLPMPKLDNFSGFNRDSRSIAKPIAPLEDEWPTDSRRNSDFDRRDNLESLFQNSEIQEPQNESYADQIRGTWREDFAKKLPPNLSEDEFMARYNLEKSLQESSEIEASAIVDHRPEGLRNYTLVESIWQYLHGKEDRNLKQISDAFRKSGQISEEDLRAHLGDILSYKEGIKSVLLFGVHEGFIEQISEDVFREIQKH